RIAIGWLLTLPAAGIVGAVAALIAGLGPVGILIDTVLGVGVVTLIFWLSRRNQVHSDNAVEPAPVQGQSEVAASARAVKIKKVKPLKKERTRKESA
ncbi:hypothetical protein N136_00452, partial [Leifsonia aquatica ATCC 14665]